MDIPRRPLLQTGRKAPIIATVTLFLLVGLLLSWECGAVPLPGARVEGRVVLIVPSERERQDPAAGVDLSGVVVYLAPQGHALDLPPPPVRPVVSQRHAQFDPPLLVAVKGQTVDFPNDDKIDHNVFSFSKAKRFDLGVYPKGERKSVTFDAEGPVMTFCSVHELMSGAVYVVPNPLFAVSGKDGRFAIPGVPPGRYAVRTWHRRFPEGVEYVVVREIDVSGAAVSVTVDLAAGWPR